MNNFIKDQKKYKLKTFSSKKYTEHEFFIADDIEIASFRDEIASMEHPFFSLKCGDIKDREYKNGNVTVIVRSNSLGLATVFDKDIWIYAISKLQQAIFEKKSISRTISFTPYDFFILTNRDNGGKNYENLKLALKRLKSTTIETNIVYSQDKYKTKQFGLIDSWCILEEKKGQLNVGMIEITLPDWLYQRINQTKILKISADYFRIRKAIDRRLYEIARKHCGYQKSFTISLELLYLKSGSTALLKMFRYNVKKLAQNNNLPNYKTFYNVKTDSLTFKYRKYNIKKY